jgi:hypothetical protein
MIENKDWKLSGSSKPFRLQCCTDMLSSEKTIQFILPEAMHITLAVYDINGKIVTNLIDGDRPAGINIVIWDKGETPSGIYNAVLKSGKITEISQMIIMK